MAGYIYDDAGNPIWFLASGAIVNNVFTAEVRRRFAAIREGAVHGRSLSPASTYQRQLGTVSLVFTDARNGTITLPDGRQVAITRFAF